jgi:4-hydroxybenzoate polyprenyltransferase
VAFPFLQTILVTICFALSNAGSNQLNAWSDYREDGITKSSRPVPSGLIDRDVVVGAVGITLGFSVLIAGLISGMFFIIISAILLSSWLYSAPPFRVKRRLHFNQLAIATPRGALGVLAAWSVVGSILDPPILALAFILAVLTFGANASKDIGDIDGDRAAGVRNWATEYGPRTTLIMVSVFTMLAGIYALVFVSLGLLPQGMIIFGFAAGAGGVAILGMKRDAVWKGGNHPSWALFYALLAGAIVIFSTSFFY